MHVIIGDDGEVLIHFILHISYINFMAWEGAGRVQGARWMKSALPVNFQDAMQPSHAAVLGRNVAAHRVESCLHHHHHDVRGRRHQLAQHSNLVTCELCDITMAKDEWEQRKKGARHRRNTAASRLSLKGGPACSVSRPAISCRHNAARGYGPSKSQLGQWCSERGERERERESPSLTLVPRFPRRAQLRPPC